MEIRQLRAFQTVAKLLSFHRAAQHLNYAQSSISAQILGLEEELGVRLFDRLGRSISLTEEGERLVPYAEKILDLADESRAELGEAREPRGSLTIRIPESLGAHRLPPVMKRFRSRFPKVGVYFVTCAHEGLQKDLRKGITDLAFLLAESIHAGDLEVEALGVEPIVIVAHPEHPLAKRRVVHTCDLQGEMILLSRVDCSYRRPFEQILHQEGVKIDTTLGFNSVETIRQCVASGLGITILPKIAATDDIARGRLSVVPWAEGPIEVAILMIWHKEKWLSPALRAFMETVREVMTA